MNSKNALIKLSNMTSPYYWRTKEQIELIKIVEQSLDQLEKLEKENQEVKNTILSLELDTCISELKKENQELRKSIKSWNETAGNLLKENRKLKKAIEILKGFKIDLIDYCDGHYSLDILYDTGGLTKEQYKLLKEVLENE